MLTVDHEITTDQKLLAVLRRLEFEPASGPQLLAYGLAPDTAGVSVAALKSGVAPHVCNTLVVRHGLDYQVRTYDEFGNVECEYLSPHPSQNLFFQADPFRGAPHPVQVREDDLDDTNFCVVAAAERVKEVELDQFYVPGGFLKLSCSHELPAERLAAALLVAFDVLAETTDREVGRFEPGKARA